jgi:RNA polymerase sigma factor (sigma-70 family)
LSADLNERYLAFAADANHAEVFWSAVLAFVKSITRDDDEDLSSVVMIKLLEAIANYRHEAKIENWIRRVVRNAKIDQSRRHSEDAMEANDLERLQADRLQEPALLLDLSVIPDAVDHMLADLILHGDSIAVAAEKCNMTERGARKRLRRLGMQLGSSSNLIF